MKIFPLRLALVGALLPILAGAFTGCAPKEVKIDPDKQKIEAENMKKMLQKEHENKP